MRAKKNGPMRCGRKHAKYPSEEGARGPEQDKMNERGEARGRGRARRGACGGSTDARERGDAAIDGCVRRWVANETQEKTKNERVAGRMTEGEQRRRQKGRACPSWRKGGAEGVGGGKARGNRVARRRAGRGRARQSTPTHANGTVEANDRDARGRGGREWALARAHQRRGWTAQRRTKGERETAARGGRGVRSRKGHSAERGGRVKETT